MSPRRRSDESDPFEDEEEEEPSRRSIFATGWFRAVLVLAVLAIVGVGSLFYLAVERSAPPAPSHDPEDRRIPAPPFPPIRPRPPEGPPATPTSADGEKPAPRLFWNSWTEAQGPATYAPVPYLEPRKTYALRIHLAGIPYAKGMEGVDVRAIGQAFKTRLASWLDTTSLRSVDLKTLALVDPAFFEPVRAPEGTLRVNLDKMRKLRAGELPSRDGSPFEILAREPDPDFVFGRVVVILTTGTREGRTSVGIVLWQNGRSVEELSIPLCVASSAAAASQCKGQRTVEQALKGIDSVRLATEPKAPYPDAALHFLAEGDRVTGVFRRNDAPAGEYVIWPVGANAEEFERTLADTFGPPMKSIMLEGRYDEQRLLDLGDDLYRLLFPNTEPGRAARAAFEAFVRERATGEATGDVLRKPSLYIRVVPRGGFRPLLVPLGLVAMDLGADWREFVGFLFRIETPLEFPSYQPGASCLSRWVMVLPPDDGFGDDELRTARQNVGPLMGDAWLKKAAARNESFDTMVGFGRWLKGLAEDPGGGTLVLLGHHDASRFFFKKNDNLIYTAIGRNFREPSVAILSGCGTGGPGALKVIQGFNQTNVTAIVATSFEVSPHMAGRFLDCLSQVVAPTGQESKEITMSHAYAGAILCLRGTEFDGAKYGGRALLYSLFGNGYLRLCPPA